MSIIAQPIASCLEENRNCFQCNGKLYRHGKRIRFLWRDGIREKHWLQRYICSNCRKCFTALSQDMLPFKHHAASSIEASISSDANVHMVENSTFIRWKNEFQQWLLKAFGALNNFLLQHFENFHGIKDCTLDAFRELLTLLPQGRIGLFDTTLEYIYWLSVPE